ncbi:hypothetical protein B0H10DRAFT_2239846 [Mycena sp. CBHHK59/15]|nr:hypothetical protein B0H10DRAFT_2248506 [Mycena sp. CBHHK59/15]KAJ6562678.1 hypothetical protein B0H10DRAFT_2239846 [Mycena sp. CBHHK59/15]
MLQTKQFAHIPSINWLCLLTNTPKALQVGLELAPDDASRFKKMQGGLDKYQAAMVLFRKRGKKGAAAEEDENEKITGTLGMSPPPEKIDLYNETRRYPLAYDSIVDPVVVREMELMAAEAKTEARKNPLELDLII